MKIETLAPLWVQAVLQTYKEEIYVIELLQKPYELLSQ